MSRIRLFGEGVRFVVCSGIMFHWKYTYIKAASENLDNHRVNLARLLSVFLPGAQITLCVFPALLLVFFLSTDYISEKKKKKTFPRMVTKCNGLEGQQHQWSL
ncbi:hypothetical protein OUZ56_008908 [Daphnia magna]|uniref:Uncharacterized protein n=1 Tax=Daphnia magna TaxID=35525 RepID=A0ABR0AEE3_9CRUS|nr:hypothetical protein OUZ56_008908 [Daphnia magna]